LEGETGVHTQQGKRNSTGGSGASSSLTDGRERGRLKKSKIDRTSKKILEGEDSKQPPPGDGWMRNWQETGREVS